MITTKTSGNVLDILKDSILVHQVRFACPITTVFPSQKYIGVSLTDNSAHLISAETGLEHDFPFGE